VKKPLGRVIEPVVTIGLVFLAFTFIPWLSGAQSAKGSTADRIHSGARSLKKDRNGEVGKVVDIGKLGAPAQEPLKEIGDSAKDIDVKKLGARAPEKLKELGSSSSGGPAKEGGTGGLRGAIKALEQCTREELGKAKALDEPRQQP
jgi:hypothetical protein